MSKWWWIVIGCGVAFGYFFIWCLCKAAARGDQQLEQRRHK